MQIELAVHVLLDKKLYRDALVLARMHLGDDSEITRKILERPSDECKFVCLFVHVVCTCRYE